MARHRVYLAKYRGPSSTEHAIYVHTGHGPHDAGTKIHITGIPLHQDTCRCQPAAFPFADPAGLSIRRIGYVRRSNLSRFEATCESVAPLQRQPDIGPGREAVPVAPRRRTSRDWVAEVLEDLGDSGYLEPLGPGEDGGECPRERWVEIESLVRLVEGLADSSPIMARSDEMKELRPLHRRMRNLMQ